MKQLKSKHCPICKRNRPLSKFKVRKGDDEDLKFWLKDTGCRDCYIARYPDGFEAYAKEIADKMENDDLDGEIKPFVYLDPKEITGDWLKPPERLSWFLFKGCTTLLSGREKAGKGWAIASDIKRNLLNKRILYIAVDEGIKGVVRRLHLLGVPVIGRMQKGVGVIILRSFPEQKLEAFFEEIKSINPNGIYVDSQDTVLPKLVQMPKDHSVSYQWREALGTTFSVIAHNLGIPICVIGHLPKGNTKEKAFGMHDEGESTESQMRELYAGSTGVGAEYDILFGYARIKGNRNQRKAVYLGRELDIEGFKIEAVGGLCIPKYPKGTLPPFGGMDGLVSVESRPIQLKAETAILASLSCTTDIMHKILKTAVMKMGINETLFNRTLRKMVQHGTVIKSMAGYKKKADEN